MCVLLIAILRVASTSRLSIHVRLALAKQLGAKYLIFLVLLTCFNLWLIMKFKPSLHSAQITKHYGTHATAKTRTTTIEKSCIRAYLPIYFLPTCMKLK